MIIFSNSTKQMMMVELIVQWAECVDEAQERGTKYQELAEQCKGQGWTTRCEPIDIGCRAFAGRSLCRVLTKLGTVGLAKKKAVKLITDATERVTMLLWLKREGPWLTAAGVQAGD